ncbi:BSD domain [Dillenia turbinata]|uniref:BSD domain n=1 Tax=Dillenia turbinata TaxID=194707 RepID=A0AAN8WC01_9MAGN
MSWFSIPLPNPFKLSGNDQQESQSLGEGVREDLSVFTETIGKQLRGVASFLSPPPPQPQNDAALDSSSSTSSSSPRDRNLVGGIKNDLVEIGGSFKSLLVSNTKAVSEISKFASNLLQFDSDDDNDSEPLDHDFGITDEVVDFVKEISTRPECWTDFPLSFNNEFIADFSMSDIQREHASMIEQLIPNLQALRLELCTQIGEKQFWIIYFILLLPRLNEHDSKLLSTTEVRHFVYTFYYLFFNCNVLALRDETSFGGRYLRKAIEQNTGFWSVVVEARDVLLQKLQNKKNLQVDDSEDSQGGSKVGDIEEAEISSIQEKQVLSETVNAVEQLEIDKHENIAQWFEDEDADTGVSSNAQKRLGNEDDVSFSDLEDDDEDDTDLSSHRTHSRLPASKRESSPSGSSDWVQLNENAGTRIGQIKAEQTTSREKDSEGEESNDWLTVDDVDSDSPAVV